MTDADGDELLRLFRKQRDGVATVEEETRYEVLTRQGKEETDMAKQAKKPRPRRSEET